MSRRKRERRDKREPFPDFDPPAQQAGFFMQEPVNEQLERNRDN